MIATTSNLPNAVDDFTRLGNSVAVAKQHYLQVTDSHFEAAIGSENDQGGARVGAETKGSESD